MSGETGADELALGNGASGDLERPDRPQPELEVIGVRSLDATAGPELEFDVRVTDASGRQVHMAALTTVIEIEPARRSYDPEARERLGELFGVDDAWSSSTQNVRLARASALVPAFRGEGAFTINVPCGFDLEVAATKYIYALTDGEVPLRFHFNGTIFYRDDAGSLQVIPVPWDRSTRFLMPVAHWRAAIEAHYPGTAWIALEGSVLERLRAFKTDEGLPSYAAAVQTLLERANVPDGGAAETPGGEG